MGAEGRREDDSLPLMGIENDCAGCEARSATRFSLPLMGIENSRWPLTMICWRSCSLPLMGIENVRCLHQREVHGSELITPHGDRKHASSALAASRPFLASLPLMGIENLFVAARVSTSASLITPHGDRKLVGAVGEGYRLRDLITPHGDRKPRIPVDIEAPDPVTHYPSWGSKTRPIISSARPPRTLSLPLMGIENSRRTIFSIRPFSSSLPLMGIENARLATGGWKGSTVLITPHGDRKRYLVYDRLAGPPRYSLPLMGIENFLTDGREGPRNRAHYPSWGSKTGDRVRISAETENSLPLMGIDPPPCAHVDSRHPKLITPHGDRKPAACPGPRSDPIRPLITPHGDRKPSSVASNSAARPISLPLMGIENACSPATSAGPTMPLITPHGDRKR